MSDTVLDTGDTAKKTVLKDTSLVVLTSNDWGWARNTINMEVIGHERDEMREIKVEKRKRRVGEVVSGW